MADQKSWKDIREDLDQYNGGPHDKLLPILEALTRINDDLHHDRRPLLTDYMRLFDTTNMLFMQLSIRYRVKL